MKGFMHLFRAILISLSLFLAPSLFTSAYASNSVIVDTGTAELSNDGSAEFQSTYETVKGWLEGYLGKLLIIIFFLVGIFMAIAKRDLMATLGAFALAFIVSIAPDVLESIT